MSNSSLAEMTSALELLAQNGLSWAKKEEFLDLFGASVAAIIRQGDSHLLRQAASVISALGKEIDENDKDSALALRPSLRTIEAIATSIEQDTAEHGKELADKIVVTLATNGGEPLTRKQVMATLSPDDQELGIQVIKKLIGENVLTFAAESTQLGLSEHGRRVASDLQAKL